MILFIIIIIMNLLLNIWKQPKWIKWLIYFLIVYILFLVKEAFAIVLWFLFCIVLYYIIFANNIFKSRTYYEKEI
jgi:chromate transport protein ChrA